MKLMYADGVSSDAKDSARNLVVKLIEDVNTIEEDLYYNEVNFFILKAIIF